jgi:transglutaminase-like putative cysteine protease
MRRMNTNLKMIMALGMLVISLLAAPLPAADWPDENRTIDSPKSYSYGLAWDGSDLYNVDYNAGRIFKINRQSGRIKSRSINAPCRKPTGLTWDGRCFWVASQSTGRIYRVNRKGKIISNIKSPGSYPAGLAWMDGKLWCADSKSNRVQLLNPKTGKVLRDLKTNALKPTGLAWDGSSLWVYCALNQVLYCVDPLTGKEIRSVASPSPYTRGLEWDGEHLWASCRGGQGLIEVNYVAMDNVTLSSPIRKRIEMVHRMENLGDNPMTDISVVFAIPRDHIRQKVHNFKFSKTPVSMFKDKYGQEFAIFEKDILEKNESYEVRWTAMIDLCSARWQLDSSKIANSVDQAEFADYLQDTENYGLSDPKIQQFAREAIAGYENAPLMDRIRAIRAYIFDRVDYEMVGGWDPARTILERGTGSCSEFTYCFNALLRSNGIATRNIGSTVYSSRNVDGHWADQVFHRWLEIYIPGYGWVPFDSNSDDHPNGRKRERYRRWASLSNNLFMTTILPQGGDQTPIGWNYNTGWDYSFKYDDRYGKYRNYRAAFWSNPDATEPSSLLDDPLVKKRYIRTYVPEGMEEPDDLADRR